MSSRDSFFQSERNNLQGNGIRISSGGQSPSTLPLGHERLDNMSPSTCPVEWDTSQSPWCIGLKRRISNIEYVILNYEV